MNPQNRLLYGKVIQTGLIAGVIVTFLGLVGLITVFAERSIVDGVISLGHLFLLLPVVGAGFTITRQAINLVQIRKWELLLASALTGLLAEGVLALFVLLGGQIDIRSVFINASTVLYDMITFDLGVAGTWTLPVIGALLGVLGSALCLLPSRFQQPIIRGLLGLLFVGLFAGLVRVLLIARPGLPATIGRFLFGQVGLTPAGALITATVIIGSSAAWTAWGKSAQDSYARLPSKGQTALRWTLLGILTIFVLILPRISGAFIAQAIVLISLYVLMGLGLNITLGFAGLLDLGFVAFFAMGAYTVALLTSYGEFGLAHISYWVAVPLAVLVAFMVGAFLGLPVLGIRGDYLAIATLGFGEIVRILAGSDFLGKWLGGPQGVIGIQKPCLGFLEPFERVGVAQACNGIQLSGPTDLYYLAIVSSILVAFVATRLRDSRLGRAWIAIREDEDVAEALGVNLIQTKLLAYMLGASFAGLGGAIFAVLVGSIFASSMQLIVSINVVSLIIVGGIGSIPGVVVGSIALIGLPELFREFSEYRFLFYGAALIVMMLAKPEGFWPSQIVQRELHAVEESET